MTLMAVSICNWRESTLPANSDRKTYNDFHYLSVYDPANTWILDMMRLMKIDGVKVNVLTGRMEEKRKKSEEWLKRYHVSYDWMQMRGNDDYRSSETVKAEYISLYYMEEIRMIFDDNPKVINSLKDLGYPTFQVRTKV